ncbi:AAA ATPase, AAA+ lid domain [Dillenia turbinata]|uniref:AAA ATPase, AAA+ lid domain n=1 Tax=Dillenia turbinata TaxID=194707 RepID=A0AAN8ZR83_9MAGN
MRLSESSSLSSSSSSSENRNTVKGKSKLGSRTRKKHKRLDTICEKAYNRNRQIEEAKNNGLATGEEESELRRSSRVRKRPVILDASLPPVKKRRKLNGKWNFGLKKEISSVEKVKVKNEAKGFSSPSEDLVETDGWRSRSRSRVRNVDVKGFCRMERESLVKSKRLGKTKDENLSDDGDPAVECDSVKENDDNGINEVDKEEKEEVVVVVEEEKENKSSFDSSNDEENGVEVDNDTIVLEKNEETEMETHVQLNKSYDNDDMEIVEESNKLEEPPENLDKGENEWDGDAAVEINEIPGKEKEDKEEGKDGEDDSVLRSEKGENVVNADKLNSASGDALAKPHIKEGRRCGLCGGVTDGKHPKKLLNMVDESDNETYSSSTASEEPNYDIWDGFGDEPGCLGQLLGPVNDRFGIARVWVHQHCAVWSPEVYFAGLGCWKNVRAALYRGRALKCTCCGRRGATIGCHVDRCPKTYHLMKAKKMKMEMRKLFNDASRKDIEAEEKWLENCGEDEEFLRRESKRLHRDILRVAPVYIGGSYSENGKQFEGWESVAGLQDVIRCMKEVVILPLLEDLSCSGIGGFVHSWGSARKGADCLGKYVGDAERQLRLLFQVVEKSQPSIIFLDEIDGLAPRRTRQQDQTHSSVVSTLLALLDGLKSRGSVVVIGATNRPDAIDPALRHPGRFDRDIYFLLPSVKDRAAILSLHTRRWPKPVARSMLEWIERKTAGFAGADLQALCTQAAILALKRSCPLQEILSAAGDKALEGKLHPILQFQWMKGIGWKPFPVPLLHAPVEKQELLQMMWFLLPFKPI